MPHILYLRLLQTPSNGATWEPAAARPPHAIAAPASPPSFRHRPRGRPRRRRRPKLPPPSQRLTPTSRGCAAWKRERPQLFARMSGIFDDQRAIEHSNALLCEFSAAILRTNREQISMTSTNLSSRDGRP